MSVINNLLVSLYKEFLISEDSSELNLRLSELKAECLGRIIEASRGDTRDALQANKYLLEFKLNGKDKRPSKEDSPNLLEEHYALLESRKEQV